MGEPDSGTIFRRAQDRNPDLYAGEEQGIAYIAMRYVAGDDVRSLARREGRLDPPGAARITAQLGSALDAPHAAGLVHRDIKRRTS